MTASLPIAASMETVNCAVARRSVSNSTVAPIVVKMPYLPRAHEAFSIGQLEGQELTEQNPLDRKPGQAKRRIDAAW